MLQRQLYLSCDIYHLVQNSNSRRDEYLMEKSKYYYKFVVKFHMKVADVLLIL